MCLLQLRNFGLSIGENTILKSMNCQIQAAEMVALVGESGSGKSVTALSLLRLLNNASYSGELIFNRRQTEVDILQLQGQALRDLRSQEIALIFQEPMTALNPLISIGQQIAEVLLVKQRWNKTDTKQRTIELLQEVGIADANTRLQDYPHQFSGGQRQRILIAMALAAQPKLLIADEPTTALDAGLRLQILELLQQIQRRHHTAVLLISHDLQLVRSYAQRVIVLSKGEIVEQGSSAAIFSNPQHAATKQLLASKLPQKAQPANSSLPLDAAPQLEAKNVTVNYAKKDFWRQRLVGTVTALQQVSFKLLPGRTLAVIGESGSGKTSLALALLDLLPAQGEIAIHGNSWASVKQQGKTAYLAQRKAVQIVFQDPFASLSPKLKLLDLVTEGMHLLGKPFNSQQQQQLALQALQEVGLTPGNTPNLLQRYPHEFSGGQRQRIAIARALLVKPDILVLDEPSSALDVVQQKRLIELLQQLQQQHGLSYLLITHDLPVVRALADEIMVLRQGEVVETNSAAQLFERPQHPYTQQLLAAQAKLLH